MEPVVDPGATVTPGEIRLNTVVCLIRHEDVEVWEVDCQSKYAEVAWLDNKIGLFAGIETLRPNEELRSKTTWLDFGKDKSWRTSVSGGRYSFTIVLFRQRSEGSTS